MAAIEDFLADAKRRMDKSIEATHHEFNSIRTGRASPALLDRIAIDYYGTPTPLKSLASISAPAEARRAKSAPLSATCSARSPRSLFAVAVENASNTPRAMPSGAPTRQSAPPTENGTANTGESACTFEPGEAPFMSSAVEQVRCSGMNASAMRTQRLPVPRIPTVCQSSTISTSAIGTKHMRGSGGPEPRFTDTPTINQSAWSTPLAKRPLPLRRR